MGTLERLSQARAQTQALASLKRGGVTRTDVHSQILTMSLLGAAVSLGAPSAVQLAPGAALATGGLLGLLVYGNIGSSFPS